MTSALRIIILFFLIAEASAQEMLPDTLSYKRRLLTTGIYRRGEKMSAARSAEVFLLNTEASASFRTGRILFPAGLMVSGAAVCTGWNALKGIPASAEVNGRNYDYRIRSLPKLLIGIAGLATGISLIEYSNDLRVKAVKRYNHRIKNRENPLSLRAGVSPDGQPGIFLNF